MILPWVRKKHMNNHEIIMTYTSHGSKNPISHNSYKVIQLYIMLSNGFSKLLRKPLAACLSASPKTKPAQKEDQCYERNSRISMKERARPVCGIDDSGRVSSRFLIDRLPKISQNTWFVWVRFLLSRFPNLTVQERPGRYVPLESTW